MSLLVVGTVAFDTIETPSGKEEKILGGAATYTCITSSYFVSPNIVSIVGYDFPSEHIEKLKEHNVNLLGLEHHQTEKTFFWEGKYRDDMNVRDTINTQLNVLEFFDPIIPDLHLKSNYIMLGNVIPSVQLKVLSQLRSDNSLVAMDTMNLWIENAYEDLIKVIKQVDILMINDQEIQQLQNVNDIEKAVQKTFLLGPSFIIVKLGSAGSMLFSKEEKYICPAVTIKDVIDPTGAGDCFAGGFMGYLSSTENHSFENMKKAISWATVMASFCVQGFGTKTILNLKEEDYLKRFNENFS
jgi:sugar/nucleoside kinase (ribokinase family)